MPSEAQPAIHVDRRRPGLALVVALLAAVPYVIGLVLPYYANGVHLRPADETIYAYDLGTMWPYDTALGGVVAFIADRGRADGAVHLRRGGDVVVVHGVDAGGGR